jgi:hypothetical protein
VRKEAQNLSGFTFDVGKELGLLTEQEHAHLLDTMYHAAALRDKIPDFDFKAGDPTQMTSTEIIASAKQAGVTAQDIEQKEKEFADNTLSPQGMPSALQLLRKSGKSLAVGNTILATQAASRITDVTNHVYTQEPAKQDQESVVAWLKKLKGLAQERSWLMKEESDGLKRAQAYEQLASLFGHLASTDPTLMQQSDTMREGIHALRALSARAMQVAAQEATQGGLDKTAEELRQKVPDITLGVDPAIVQADPALLQQKVDESLAYMMDKLPEPFTKDFRMRDERTGRVVPMDAKHLSATSAMNLYEIVLAKKQEQQQNKSPLFNVDAAASMMNKAGFSRKAQQPSETSYSMTR